MTTKAEAPATAQGKTMSDGAVRGGGFPIAVLIAGWLFPGAGHFMLGKFVRAALLTLSIVGMFAIGIALAGKVYSPNTGDPLDMLGFAGDLGSGLLYGLARMLGWGAVTDQTAVQDYGKMFIVVAGLLNVVAAVDAHSLATGRKRS